jgi:hypothetical protein
MEKRRFKRTKKRLEVTINTGTRSFTTYTSNVSINGIFIRTMRVFPKFTTLTLEIKLPSNETITVQGNVKREFKIPAYGYKKNGMGIEILDAPPKYLEFVKSLDFQTDEEDTEPIVSGKEPIVSGKKFKIKRLSMNELCLLTPEHLMADNLYRIELISDRDEKITPKAKVDKSFVKGIQKVKDDNRPIYEASLTFTQMDNNEKIFLKKLIYEFINNAKKSKKPS